MSVFTLHRALTIRDMGVVDMRNQHDRVPGWVYEDPGGAQPFTPGTVRMDKEDIALGMGMFYEAMGWDAATGAPTEEAYARLGLADVGRDLKARKLLPESPA
jgi:aldehyde:ferredoxin oxidoreductase